MLMLIFHHISSLLLYLYLNTSNVNVNLARDKLRDLAGFNLNTSNVNVNLVCGIII